MSTDDDTSSFWQQFQDALQQSAPEIAEEVDNADTRRALLENAAVLEDAAQFKVPPPLPLPIRTRPQTLPPLDDVMLRELPTVETTTMIDLMQARPEIEQAINEQYLDYLTSRRNPRRIKKSDLARLLEAVSIAYPNKRLPLHILNNLYDHEPEAIPALLYYQVRANSQPLWEVLPISTVYAINLGRMAEMEENDRIRGLNRAARDERDSILTQIVADGRAANVARARDFLRNYIVGATQAMMHNNIRRRDNYVELQALADEAEHSLQQILARRGFTKPMLDAQEVLEEYNLLTAEEEEEERRDFY